jgi:hypothetical protein
MPVNIKEEARDVEEYNPKTEEYDVNEYLKKRIPILKETKKSILGGFDFEQLMRDADKEYIPHNLRENNSKGVMLVQDEVNGLRGSRIVPIGDTTGEEWRSDVSEPMLLSKIQTALAILIDQNPDATFTALNDKFKKTTKFAYNIWRRSWVVAKSQHQMKLVITDLAKYGWAIGRTYPRYIARKGKILTEINDDHPEKNKYEEVEIVQYNDIYRERLDPFKTWIDDMSNLSDPFSTNDWYYEKDYSWDSFVTEFGQYSNLKYVKKGGKVVGEDEAEVTVMRDDIVTVGFYESIDKDLYAVRIPEQDVTLFYSPIPNDQKRLSCWWTIWNIRDAKTPYGIGVYEMMRNNKVLYDRMKNMTVDQLVMAIYPMLFMSGAGGMTNQGTITISPGVIQQKAPGTNIDQVKIDYDPRGWEATEKIQEQIDEGIGITPTLQGATEAKTLGQSLQDKQGALLRMSNPLKNIAKMLEDEAFISLSWMKQIYSIPEIKRFASEEEIQSYVDETGKLAQNVESTKFNEDGTPSEVRADFYPQIELGMENRDGEMVESKENRFFNLGEDIPLSFLNWEGMIEIKHDSMLAPTPELERQRKMELFNILSPVIAQIAMAVKQDVDLAIALAKPAYQILEIQNEKPNLWLPDELIKALEDPEEYKIQQQEQQMQMQVQQQQMMQDQQAQAETEKVKAQNADKLFLPAESGTNVPEGQITNQVADTLGNMGQV